MKILSSAHVKIYRLCGKLAKSDCSSEKHHLIGNDAIQVSRKITVLLESMPYKDFSSKDQRSMFYSKTPDKPVTAKVDN